ncbi:hypothetical protein EJB05_01244, partial [Eragrostis curvula]
MSGPTSAVPTGVTSTRVSTANTRSNVSVSPPTPSQAAIAGELEFKLTGQWLIIRRVFYCGTPGLAKKLRALAKEFSRTTNTKFEFHKENF